jgi:hypothetical protein
MDGGFFFIDGNLRCLEGFCPDPVREFLNAVSRSIGTFSHKPRAVRIRPAAVSHFPSGVNRFPDGVRKFLDVVKTCPRGFRKFLRNVSSLLATAYHLPTPALSFLSHIMLIMNGLSINISRESLGNRKFFGPTGFATRQM